METRSACAEKAWEYKGQILASTGKSCCVMVCRLHAEVYDWESREISIFDVIFNVSFDVRPAASFDRGSIF